jgi:hypothetical protein
MHSSLFVLSPITPEFLHDECLLPPTALLLLLLHGIANMLKTSKNVEISKYETLR